MSLRGCLGLPFVLASAPLLFTGSIAPAATKVTVVNMMPKDQSDETNEDSEPNLAVNPANPMQMAATAFTPNPKGGDKGPIYVSTDGGKAWRLNPIVPSQTGSSTGTGDITIRFGTSGNTLYGGILRLPGPILTPRLNVLRTPDFASSAPMDVLLDLTGNGLDQPYVQAITLDRKDRLYVGCNDFNAPQRRTATIFRSLDAATAPPPASLEAIRIEARDTGTARQDGPSIRPMPHPDGTVYAAFFGWRAFDRQTKIATSDVVVVRDDARGQSMTPFTALQEPPPPEGDGKQGVRVVRERKIPWDAELGQDRTGSDLAIAVDARSSDTVYIAWADRVGDTDYTLHVRRSTDRGVTWSAQDLRTVTNAKNPGLASNRHGTVGFLYQELKGSGASARWKTHLERTDDGFTTKEDLILADSPVNGWLGDYAYLTAIGQDFYGVFCADNTPDKGNFPEGVQYQRNADFTKKKLLGTDGTTEVDPSIDPFFFRTN